MRGGLYFQRSALLLTTALSRKKEDEAFGGTATANTNQIVVLFPTHLLPVKGHEWDFVTMAAHPIYC